MKKLFLVSCLLSVVSLPAPASTDNGNCKYGADLDNTELTAPGMKKVCKREFNRGWKYYWSDISAWCWYNGTEFNANIHTAEKDDGARCWRIKCTAGAKPWGNLTTCSACNADNQKIQNGVCYTITDPNCLAANPDGGYVIYANPDKPTEAPRCLPICDVQTAAASFDTTDSSKLVFKIFKQNAGTIGSRSQ